MKELGVDESKLKIDTNKFGPSRLTGLNNHIRKKTEWISSGLPRRRTELSKLKMFGYGVDTAQIDDTNLSNYYVMLLRNIIPEDCNKEEHSFV